MNSQSARTAPLIACMGLVAGGLFGACVDSTPGTAYIATVEEVEEVEEIVDAGAPNYPECSACLEEAALVDGLVNEQLEQPDRTYDEDLAICYLVGQLPWEDEDAPGQTDDTAINCRDFTRWFVECMTRLGHESEGLGMYCKNCDSGKSKGHAIAIYERPDGNWCPGEPQRVTGGEWSDCCKATKEEASQCALERHCGAHGRRDACCEPKEHEKYDCSGEKCRLIVNIDGTEYLNCDLGDGGVIGVPGGDPIPPEVPIDRDDSDECLDAIRECLARDNLGSCEDCRRTKLDACRPDYADCTAKATNAECTACCNASGNFQECAKTAGCSKKPSRI